MRSVVKVLLPVLVLGGSIWTAQKIIDNKPQPERQTAPTGETRTSVEVMRLVPQSYRVQVATHGTVRPRTESSLVPEVSGRVIEVSQSFRDGGFFEKGEVLLRIDPRDYEIAVTVAEAQVAQTRLRLEEEVAQGKVAEHDWRQLKASDPQLAQRRSKLAAAQLALRKPQLAAAKAELAAAQAELRRAHLNLERTRITAPYEGRVLELSVDVGQHVSNGTALARVYAVDYVEIRLPLTNHQIEYVELPEAYRGEPVSSSSGGPPVTVKAQLGRQHYTWQGKVVRAEGAIDTRSRQLFVVAQVDDPYAKGPMGRPPLRIGQYVEAVIEGKLLQDVFVVPSGAFSGDRELFLVDRQNRLQRRTVSVLWRNDSQVVVASGLSHGELLCLSAQHGVPDGEAVAVTVSDSEAGGDVLTSSPEPSLPPHSEDRSG